MTKNKKVLIAVSIVFGILLTGTSIYLFMRQRQNSTFEENEHQAIDYEERKGKPVGSSSQSNYTKDQIKQAQQKLLEIGYKYNNTLIINSIINTGGIDGVIGSGFNKALKEAIKKGYVTKITDLLPSN